MTHPNLRAYGPRRVYSVTPRDGAVAFRLRECEIELGTAEAAAYAQFAEWLPTMRSVDELRTVVGMDEAKLTRFATHLAAAGLLYKKADLPAELSGEAFHKAFSEILPSWLSEAFSHPFWEKMMCGRGSKRLYTGWLIELYHYTRNANRHMPLACAHTREKAIKRLHAKHYAEEWDHYHFFTKSLKALGYPRAAIAESVPLPMTMALSNFMRQAAREDILAYSICSAVLEGTTTDRSSFNPYYETCAKLYDVPHEAIQPIYAHLDLDLQYEHSDLFHEILCTVPSISAERASRVLDYGHQLVEHIWLWTENIDNYYSNPKSALPRRPFDPFLE
jgi:pyrroloquinoline quinone (PQQ) biosynthesis protein C